MSEKQDYNEYARVTVGELIAALEEHDPASLVLVNGYEGGYQAPNVIVFDVNQERGGSSYCGPWDPARKDDEARERAVVVSREWSEHPTPPGDLTEYEATIARVAAERATGLRP